MYEADGEGVDMPTDADTLGAFITKRIHDMFCELAEKASKMELTEDESAGVPMTLFAAENYLPNCWKAYTQDETAIRASIAT